MKNRKLLIVISSVCLALIFAAVPFLGACAGPAQPAGPITLKLTTFLPTHLSTVRYGPIFAEKVTQQANGELIIEVAGGPEVVPGDDQPRAVGTGVIDIVLTPPDEAIVPESGSFFLSQRLPYEERDNGLYDYIAELYEKQNVFYLGRGGYHAGFFYTTVDKVDSPADFKGMKSFSSGTFDPFVEALGMAGVNMPSPEGYTALERGVINAFPTTLTTHASYSIHEVASYIIMEPFYTSGILLMMNLDKWNQLPKHLQQVMKDVALEVERDMVVEMGALEDKAIQELIDGGMEMIEFSPADSKAYNDLAYQSVWDSLETKLSPETISKLKQLMAK